jgi:hypothetical protein
MTEYNCKRCNLDFDQKIHLIKHLKRKNICMAIESEKSQEELLEELNKKQGIECTDCKRVYKNENSLRAHKCKVIKNVNNEEIEKLKKMFDAKIKELEKKIETNQPINITNNITNNIDNSTTNNIVVINSINKAGSDPIKYLLEQSAESILKWFNGMDGLLAYLEEKFFNEEHPENKMIRMVDINIIELHFSGGWNRFEKKNGMGWILTNVGNDYGEMLDTLKYKYEENKNKKSEKKLKSFEKDIIKPLEWGYDVNSNEEVTKTMTQLEDGTTVFKEDVEEEEHNEKMKEYIQEETTKLVENKCKSKCL